MDSLTVTRLKPSKRSWLNRPIDFCLFAFTFFAFGLVGLGLVDLDLVDLGFVNLGFVNLGLTGFGPFPRNWKRGCRVGTMNMMQKCCSSTVPYIDITS